MRTYSELVSLPTFEERFKYLQLKGTVAEETFGFDRYLNQKFYHDSTRWKAIRNKIIIRDNGCDLGMKNREIIGSIYVHHMNPITVDDIVNNTEVLWNPEFLICTSFDTHNAIHYGNIDLLPKELVVRTKNDTCPWKK